MILPLVPMPDTEGGGVAAWDTVLLTAEDSSSKAFSLWMVTTRDRVGVRVRTVAHRHQTTLGGSILEKQWDDEWRSLQKEVRSQRARGYRLRQFHFESFRP